MKKIALILAVAIFSTCLLCACDTAGSFAALVSPEANEEQAEPGKITEDAGEELPPEEVVLTPCSIRVMSYNMRCKNSNPTKEQDSWVFRRDTEITRIKNNDPDLLGTQELVIEQKLWVLEQLGDTYSCVGFARDTVLGVEMGEGSYIFYKTDMFELLETGTEWLSETPTIRSYGWDAACRRVVTFVKLKHKASNQIITYYNTHLDHKGDEAMKNGNAQILAHIANENGPCIYTGDLNFNEKSSNYSTIVEQLNDSKYAAEVSTGGVTYTGYNMNVFKNINSGLAIDHCFVTKDIVVNSYKVDNELINEKFGSDHFPIVVDMVIGSQNE